VSFYTARSSMGKQAVHKVEQSLGIDRLHQVGIPEFAERRGDGIRIVVCARDAGIDTR